jgi:hypothetical protein
LNPHSYAPLIFEKSAKNIQWRIDSLFNKRCWESGYFPARHWNEVHAYHPVPVSTQSWLRTLISDLKPCS